MSSVPIEDLKDWITHRQGVASLVGQFPDQIGEPFADKLTTKLRPIATAARRLHEDDHMRIIRKEATAIIENVERKKDTTVRQQGWSGLTPIFDGTETARIKDSMNQLETLIDDWVTSHT